MLPEGAGSQDSGIGRLVDAWRDRPWASTGAAVAVVAAIVAGWWLGRPSAARPVEDQIPFAPGVVSTAGSLPEAVPSLEAGTATTTEAAGQDTGPDELVVHVTGAVSRPGIVRLEPGDRVIDAVDAAGGPTADADVDQLNLAAPVSDGLQIRVPRQGETLAPVATAPTTAGGATAGGAAPLDLNQATAVELEQLPGIGPSLAAAIVTWRQDHGPFRTVEDLLDVPGIGPAKLEALADLVFA
jgi:competence protein ComEA